MKCFIYLKVIIQTERCNIFWHYIFHHVNTSLIVMQKLIYDSIGQGEVIVW
jgi:hypothetical protein